MPPTGPYPRNGPHFRRARTTLLQSTRNANSIYGYYKNGYRIDVEMMPNDMRIATNRPAARAAYGSPCRTPGPSPAPGPSR
ncbi:hypothetical protein FPZ47_18795 [Mycobacterium helveticum]|uniref:Uncharacterized protein n=1 Tax=Mycobacterium helveticum TaxID=2592811 RepID=A0A557XJT4_9MYCO|nr:hypothetical protein FPZ46_19555 [Mycobacterium helveticum]TVS86022.1 hypothetical protein FPZ47_18795 [Mycobacterium helveticum]